MKINEAAAAAEDCDRWKGILRAANLSDGGIKGTERRRVQSVQDAFAEYRNIMSSIHYCQGIYRPWPTNTDSIAPTALLFHP